ncbi:hypothetical protein EON65_16050 [archaeon]|nr:MAG: hypothetical protein EON65_16050 [archaeon]
MQAAVDATPEALELRDLENDREKEEREKRESISRDQEEERQRLAQKEVEELKEYERQQQILLEEEMRRLEEERQRELQAAHNAAEQDVNRWMSVLTVTDFKSLWSTLNTNGSFQCNLKSPPNQTQLTEHLKRQGFHVVFAVSPNAADIEIGICNVRPMGQEAWFMARFLVSNNSFSAVMKSQDATLVPSLVKKFALAKVLKIDTPGK